LLVEQTELVYPKGERALARTGLERMPRMCIVQQCLWLSDEGTEDGLSGS
jgi:transposase, IS5 family